MEQPPLDLRQTVAHGPLATVLDSWTTTRQVLTGCLPAGPLVLVPSSADSVVVLSSQDVDPLLTALHWRQRPRHRSLLLHSPVLENVVQDSDVISAPPVPATTKNTAIQNASQLLSQTYDCMRPSSRSTAAAIQTPTRHRLEAVVIQSRSPRPTPVGVRPSVPGSPCTGLTPHSGPLLTMAKKRAARFHTPTVSKRSRLMMTDTPTSIRQVLSFQEAVQQWETVLEQIKMGMDAMSDSMGSSSAAAASLDAVSHNHQEMEEIRNRVLDEEWSTDQFGVFNDQTVSHLLTLLESIRLQSADAVYPPTLPESLDIESVKLLVDSCGRAIQQFEDDNLRDVWMALLQQQPKSSSLTEETMDRITSKLRLWNLLLKHCQVILSVFTVLLQCARDTVRQLLREEVLSSCMKLLRNQLSKTLSLVIYNGLNLKEQHGAFFQHEQNRRLLMDISDSISANFFQLYNLLRADKSGIGSLDSLIIPLIFMALGALITDACTTDLAALNSQHVQRTVFLIPLYRQIQFRALEVIRLLFAYHPAQRGFILQEILSHLKNLPSIQLSAGKRVALPSFEPGKSIQFGCPWGGSAQSSAEGKSSQLSGTLYFRLPDGSQIHIVTAVLLQLIQSCAENWTKSCSKGVDKKPVETEEDTMPRETKKSKKKKRVEPEQDVADDGVSRVQSAAKEALDSTNSVSQYIFRFLFERITNMEGASKRSKKNQQESHNNSNEYRMVMDGLLTDCLTLLNHSEWPGAFSLVQTFAFRFMDKIETLAEPKNEDGAAHDYLSNDVRLINMEFLAWIAAVTRHIKLESRQSLPMVADKYKIKLSDPVLEGLSNRTKALAISDKLDMFFVECLKLIADHLQSDQFREYESSLGYWIAECAFHSTSSITVSDIMEIAVRSSFDSHHQTPSKFASNESEVDASDLICITTALLSNSFLMSDQFFERVISRILLTMQESSVQTRTKMLRLISLVSSSDPAILHFPAVKQAINTRTLDQSAAVRDISVELIGRYLISNPKELLDEYYSSLSARILDTGLAVRKRAIKLFKDLLPHLDWKNPGVNLHCRDLSIKLLSRFVNDDEASIRDVAHKTLQDLWFGSCKEFDIQNFVGGADQIPVLDDEHDVLVDYVSRFDLSKLEPVQKQFIDSRLTQTLQALTECGDKSLTSFLTYKSSFKMTASRGALMGFVKYFADSLVEKLLTSTDISSIQQLQLSAKKALYFNLLAVIGSSFPFVLIDHVQLLRPYFTEFCTGVTPDEQQSLLGIIRIFNVIIPYFSKSASAGANILTCGERQLEFSFVTEMEMKLANMCTKQSSLIVMAALQCLTTIITGLTNNYALIAVLLLQCYEYLRKQMDTFSSGATDVLALQPKTRQSITRALLILSNISKFIDWDEGHKDTWTAALEGLKQTVRGPTAVALERLVKEGSSQALFNVFTFFASSRMSDHVIRMEAFGSLGNFWETRPLFILDNESVRVLGEVLNPGNHLTKPSHTISTTVMSTIESSDEEDALKIKLLSVLYQFLKHDEERMHRRQNAETTAHSDRPEGDTLKGISKINTETALSASLIQQFLPTLLQLLTHSRASVRQAAFDVVQHVTRQGLVHPLQCVPHLIALIALANQPDAMQASLIGERLRALYTELMAKYDSFIHNRDMEGVQLAFEMEVGRHLYNRSAEDPAGCGYAIVERGACGPGLEVRASLTHVYESVREKRQRRRAFISALFRQMEHGWTMGHVRGEPTGLTSSSSHDAMDVGVSIGDDLASTNTAPSSSAGPACTTRSETDEPESEGRPASQSIDYYRQFMYCRYLCGNLSAFEYKVLDEPLFVLHQVHQYLSTLAVETGHFLSHCQQQQSGPQNQEQPLPSSSCAQTTTDPATLSDILYTTLCMRSLIQLKQYLQDRYQLTDTKCTLYNPMDSIKVLEKVLASTSLNGSGGVGSSGRRECVDVYRLGCPGDILDAHSKNTSSSSGGKGSSKGAKTKKRSAQSEEEEEDASLHDCINIAKSMNQWTPTTQSLSASSSAVLHSSTDWLPWSMTEQDQHWIQHHLRQYQHLLDTIQIATDPLPHLQDSSTEQEFEQEGGGILSEEQDTIPNNSNNNRKRNKQTQNNKKKPGGRRSTASSSNAVNKSRRQSMRTTSNTNKYVEVSSQSDSSD